MGRKNIKYLELREMLDIVVGDEPKAVKMKQLTNVKQTLMRGDKMLPCRKKRMDFWTKVMDEVVE